MELAILVVAALTLAVVVTTELRQRRHAPYVQLYMRNLASATDAGTGALVNHIWTLENDGTGDAQIGMVLPVDCEITYTGDRPPFSVIRAAETKRLFIEPCDTEKAWILVVWTPAHDQRFACVEWFAPAAERKLKAAQAQLDEISRLWRRAPRWLLRLVRPIRQRFAKVQPVGPGGVIKTKVRRVGSKTWRRDYTTAMSIAMPQADETIQRELDWYSAEIAKRDTQTD